MSGEFIATKYSGKHLILDLFDVDPKFLCSVNEIKKCLKKAATSAKATVLKDAFHHFGKDHGVTGIIVLSESHISIHTWPEERYAAIDIFMCGVCNPEDSIEEINNYFKPGNLSKNVLYRGIIA